MLKCLSREPQRSSFLCLPRTGNRRITPQPLFNVGSGDQILVPMLALSQQSQLQTLMFCLRNQFSYGLGTLTSLPTLRDVEMAQWGRVLVAKADCLSLNPGAHMWKERADSHKLSFDLQTHCSMSYGWFINVNREEKILAQAHSL